MIESKDKTTGLAVFSAFLLLASFFLAFSPVWKGLIQEWIASDDNSHGFFIVPVSLYAVWHNRERLSTVNEKPSRWGLPVILFSLLFYLFSVFSEISTFASLSMILFLFGVVIYISGFEMFKELLFPLCLLFLMIPVPSQVYSMLTVPLQLFVTKASAYIGGLIGIPIFHEGNIIHLPGRTIQVVHACSGLRSIMSLLTLGAVIGYFTLRSNAQRSILVVAGIPVAVAANVFRVVLLVSFLHFFEIDLATGPFHTAFGVIVFLVAVALTLMVRGVMVLCGNRVSEES